MFGLRYFVFIVVSIGDTIKWATGNTSTPTLGLTSEAATYYSLPTTYYNTYLLFSQNSYTSIGASPTSRNLNATSQTSEATLYTNSHGTVAVLSSAVQISANSIAANTLTPIHASPTTYNSLTASSSSTIAVMSPQSEITAISIHSSFIDTNSIVASLIATSLFDSYSTEPFTRTIDSSKTGAATRESQSTPAAVTLSTSTGMSLVTTYINTIWTNESEVKSNTKDKETVITLSMKAVVGVGVAFGFLVLTNFIFIFVICRRSYQAGDRPSYWHTKSDSTLDLSSALGSHPPSLSPSMDTDTQFHNAIYCETFEHQGHLSTIMEESKNAAAQLNSFVAHIHNSDIDSLPPPLKPECDNAFETDVQIETASPLRLSRHSSDSRLDKSAHGSSADLSVDGVPLGDKYLGFGTSFSNPSFCDAEELISTFT